MVSMHSAPIAANQFFQGLFCRPVADRSGPPAPPLPASADAAIANLLALMQTLCAPGGGWPADKPQTPEHLLPYVADEAEELLEVLQRWMAAAEPVVGRTPEPAAESGYQNLELGSDLSSFLLWAIAASHPAAMALLEGVSAELSQPPEAAGVRLVPVLQVQLDQVSYALDLATQTHFDPEMTLALDTLLPPPSDEAGTMPLADWQSLIWAGAIAVAPELGQWQQGVALQVLLPGRVWATATAKLMLKFVPLNLAILSSHSGLEEDWMSQLESRIDAGGMPQARVWPAEVRPAAVLETDVIAPLAAGADAAAGLETVVAFQDVAALEQAIAPVAIAQQCRFAAGAQLGPPQGLDPDQLVQAIYQVMQPQAAQLLPGLRSPLGLADLCHQVKWWWIRASQDLMPLMAGLSARRLALGQPWEPGTVVMAGYLVLGSATGTESWLDVTTGMEPLQGTALAATDILQLPTASGLPRELWTAEDLGNFLQATVRQRSPLLAHLMDEVAVKLVAPDAALFPDGASDRTLRFQMAVQFLS